MIVDLADAKFAPEDLQVLAQHQIESIVDDYIKLMHPSQRKRGYLKEAFLDARDAVFDEEFRFSCFVNDENQGMTIDELITLSMDDDRLDVNRLRQYCISQAHQYWQERPMNTLSIPDVLIFDGHTYSVLHTTQNPHIDFAQQEIWLDKNDTTPNQEQLVRFAVQVLWHHVYAGGSASPELLGPALYRLLKMNECFSPPQAP